MRKVDIEGKVVHLPSEWNEMTREQLCFLALILRDGITAMEAKVKMVLFATASTVETVLKDGGYVLALRKKRARITASQLAELGSVFDFLFAETEKGFELDVRLTKNPFRVYEHEGLTLCGPDDGLTNISYGQFVMLQVWHEQMNVRGFYMDDFFAVIWKSGIFTNDDEGDVKILKDLPLTVKTVMFWFYVGSMAFIRDRFPKVFGGNGAERGGDVFDQQQRIIDEMAQGDVTKKDTVKKCLLYDALYTLEMAIERAQKQEKK